MWDVFIMCLFGVLGFFMRTAGFEGAPLLLGIVLGPMLESDLRKSLIMSNGSFSIFMTRPISAAFLLLAIILIALPAFLWLIGRKTRLTVDLPEEESG
jgi:putative tricarboxylic transport membrane protein